MKLLTQEIEELLPPIYSQEQKGFEALAVVKFFTPASNWTWWASEANAILDDDEETEVPLADPRAAGRKDVRFFGLVEGFAREYGYWCLSELEGIQGPFGLGVERDIYWIPKPLAEC